MTDQSRALALGSLELKIMQVMWDRPAASLQVRDVLELLDQSLAYTTVMTVLSRLYDKRLLSRRRHGRAWAYRCALSREAYVAAIMTETLETAQDHTGTLLHFVAELGEGDANALRRLLAAGRPQ